MESSAERSNGVGPETRTLVLVAGASYSGTTMLDLMLGNNDRAFSCGEIYARFRPHRQLHSIGFRSTLAPPERVSIRCACGRKPCPAWARLSNVPEHQFHDQVFDRLGVSVVVDSSKRLSWVLDAHRWASARVQIHDLLIWKQPRELAYSHWRRSGDIRLWRSSFVSYHRRYFGLGLPFVSVPYHDLVADPPGTLRAICAMLGLPYADGQERFWEGEHHVLFGSGGARRQVDRGESVLSAPAFPPEFVSAWDGIASEVEQDDQVQEIRSNLLRADVRRATGPPVPSTDRTQPPSLRRPPWYYKDRAVLAYRRRFPRP